MLATGFERKVNLTTKLNTIIILVYMDTQKTLAEITNLHPTKNEIKKGLEQLHG